MTHYDIIKMHASLLATLADNRITVKDVRQLSLYEDFVSLKKQGLKHEYIVNTLSDKYGYTTRHILKIVRNFKQNIKL